MEDWAEKYRPKGLAELLGNDRAITTLRNWALIWQNGKIPAKRAVILSGKPGIGKTSCAHALAHDLHWIPIELNASDSRNASKIRRIATSGALHESFDAAGNYIKSNQGGRKLIILDEADNLYEKSAKTEGTDFSDRGGKKAILETIKKSNQPIILIVNDYYKLIKGSGESFKNLCITIQFYEVGISSIVELLKHICRSENIIADSNTLRTLAERCKGDVRSAINDLQALSINSTQLDIQDLDVLGYRDREKIIFDALRDIFKTRDLKKLRELSRSIDVPPEIMLLWIAENIPREYEHIHDLANGLEAVSKADIFFGRVYRRQYYGYWSYANDLMNCGVSLSKNHYSKNMRYYPPSWLKHKRAQKSERIQLEDLLKKLSSYFHVSNKKTKEQILPNLRLIFCNNIEFAARFSRHLKLSESEIKTLLGQSDEQLLKNILQWSENQEVAQQSIETKSDPDIENDQKNKELKEKQEIRQERLF
jgi:replication factor C large subunit